MAAITKSKAARNVALSVAFLAVLAVVSFVAHDRSVVSATIAFAIILGLPCLLLSIADLGRALKIEHGGNYRATAATRLLSHYRAAGGAICISVAGFVLFQIVCASVNGTSTAPIPLQLFRVFFGILLVLVGFFLIVRAFSKESNSEP